MTGPFPFVLGDPVDVVGVGPGIITEIKGGPIDYLYQVILFGLDIDTGLPTSRVVRDVEMTHSAAIRQFEVGDSVRYIGHLGEVVHVSGNKVTFVIPADPVGEYSGVAEPRIFEVPHWHLYLAQQV